MNLRICTGCVTCLLCAVACDPAEAPSSRESAALLEATDDLSALLPLCETLSDEPAASERIPEGPPALADAPQVAEGVCAGTLESRKDWGSCGSCDVGGGNAGIQITYYHRWCYPPPNPPSCGGCDPWEYEGYSCLDLC